MKLIIVVLAVVASALAVPFDLQESSWLNFKVTHGKTYTSPEEEHLRLSIYKSNLEKIAEHNARYAAGQVTYFLKENRFADLTHSEFREMMLGMKQDFSKQVNRTNHQMYQMRHVKVDESKDWRQVGAVTPVKDQAQCGSCWAFSTTGSLESHQFLQKGKLISLSEQNLVDCSSAQGNMGCNGGLMDAAFDYIIQNGGIDTEESYPYEAVDDVCRYNPKNIGARVKSYVDIPSGSEDALLEAVSSKGPVSVAIDASSFSFQLYGGGIYNEPYCSSYMLDHGVLAVGYGTDPEGDYWLVKNSWGASWGLTGYIKMTRDGSNQCGIATQAVYPIPA